MEILPSCDRTFDHVFVAQGTTTTSCGILLSLPNQSKLHVIPVLKGFDSKNEMKSLMTKVAFEETLVAEIIDNVVVHEDHHYGGYGKYTNALLDFMEDFYKQTKITFDV
jgi:1-aminocyclopropane-1-carboxylate deaminase